MKLKKQKIGYWISSALLDIGIILLVQSVWESRGYWLHPLLELGLVFLLPGIVAGIFFFAGRKFSAPTAGQNLAIQKKGNSV